MEIKQVSTNKKQFLSLLLLADEQESMIDRYLDRGDLFVMYVDERTWIAVAVVTEEEEGVYELKNLAVDPVYQRNSPICRSNQTNFRQIFPEINHIRQDFPFFYNRMIIILRKETGKRMRISKTTTLIKRNRLSAIARTHQ